MSTPARRDLRARDADRLAVVEHLEAALRDGQLTPVEADERIAQAREAVTIGTLEDLLGDLQDIPALEGLPARSRQRAWIAGAVAAVVVAGGVAYALNAGDHPATRPATTQRAQKPVEEAAPEVNGPETEPEAVAPAEPAEYSFTAKGMRNFIELYTDEFHKPPRAIVFGFTSEQVVFYLPNGKSGKVHRWNLDEGNFVDRGPGDPIRELDADRRLIDLRKLNIDATFAHLSEVRKQGRKALPNVDIVGLTLLRLDGAPRVVATAANGKRTQCYQIFSTLAGRVLDRGVTDCAVG